MYRNSRIIREFIKEYNLCNKYILIQNIHAKQSYIKEIILLKYPALYANKVIHLPFKYKKLSIVWKIV